MNNAAGPAGPRLVDLPTSDLLDELQSPRRWMRDMARRLLIARGADEVKQALFDWDCERPREEAALEVLWLVQGLRLDGAKETLCSTGGLNESPNPRIRAAATRVLGFTVHDALAATGRDAAP